MILILILLGSLGPADFALGQVQSGTCSIPAYNNDREACETAGGTFTAAPASPVVPSTPVSFDKLIRDKNEWLEANRDQAKCSALATKIREYTKNDLIKYTLVFKQFSSESFFGPGDYSKCQLYPYTLDAVGNRVVEDKAQTPEVKNIETIARVYISRLGTDNFGTSLPPNFFTKYSGYDPNADIGGKGFWSGLFGGISQILGWLIELITGAILALTAMAGEILVFTIKNIKAPQPPIVKEGWVIIRDLMNMIFVLAMIVMSLATILRVEAYNYKKLLTKLIIMALLINFSRVIAETLINVSNMVVDIFAQGANWGAWGESMYNILGSGKQGNFLQQFANASGVEPLGMAISKLVLALVMLTSFLAIAGLLVIRMVGLWVLVILSPVAYALNILPATATYAKKWWETFVKYLIWAPVAVFFLRLGEKMIKDSGQVGAYTGYSGTFQFIIIAGLMWAAVLVAKQAGMVGSEAIIKAAQGVGFGLPKWGAKQGVGAIGRAYSKYTSRKMDAAERAEKSGGSRGWTRFWKTAQFANLRVAKQAFDERAKEKEEEAYKPAVGQVRDSINRVIPTEWHGWKDLITGKGGLHLGQKTHYGRIGQRQMIRHKMKEWEEADLSEEEKVEAYRNAHHVEDKEALRTILGLGRHEDGAAILAALADQEAETDKRAAKYEKEGMSRSNARLQAKAEVQELVNKGKMAKAEYDSVDQLDEISESLGNLSPEQKGAVMAHQDEIGEAEQKLRMIGNAVFEFDKNFRMANDFSGFEKMQRQRGTNDMLQELYSNGIFHTQEGDIEKRKVKIKNEKGEEVEVEQEVFKQIRFKSLDKDGKEVEHVIKDYGDLQKAIGDTQHASKKSEGNLKYELTGARQQISAQKRVERGNTESWGRAEEPAAYMVQDASGNFTEFTSKGRRAFKMINPARVNSFKKSRQLQGRVIKMVGLYKDEMTGRVELKRPEIMAEAFKLNADMASAIIEKADFDQGQADEVIAKLKGMLPTEAEFETSETREGAVKVLVHMHGKSKKSSGGGPDAEKGPTKIKGEDGQNMRSPDKLAS
ncbi:MAG: hypothetical protein A3H72_02270 [Candidatus Doudnabacteria bacterium RIFCSPLOWO2_02_FULL_48_8]|nr:MAG: hypothetical protein A3H72_02270 [Candidatus Doudnabacteria bacterium RIFCSPLOWO2_02_FULL_48_8]OGE95719.1 MAG: hypothetical protein A3E98_03650 [Candidatus Doudnabacteria bacterium RIFCSPHIGHO2_12_FULL_48_11]